MTVSPVRKRIQVQGVVQGVGFRPFVYRIAQSLGVRGHVLNSSEGVVIEAEAAENTLRQFLAVLQTDLPPLARIDSLTVSTMEPLGATSFAIRQSTAVAGQFALVPPDVATCEECRRDFTRRSDRRYGYPFTNCTNCGPRYTIIRDVPYDRPKTTMEEFAMCPACQGEYDDPANRRFHAEPNACPECGPSLALLSADEMASDSPPRFSADVAVLERTRNLLQQGEIVAIKGLGGFHLACDAANDRAVGLLRERKRRSGKAFALMARDIETVDRLCLVTPSDRALLLSSRRPIVLLSRRDNTGVSGNVAPGNTRLGVMLPYTPLHYLLFENSPGYDALVMTSGNLSEEPIVSRNQEAWPRLKGLADHFLLHNREIQTRVDDSVVESFEDREYPVRRSRGFAPQPVDLGMPVQEILACGGQLKNTLCLTKDRYAILSQHIGDLENVETMEFFRETLDHLQRFFRVSPVAVAHDLHPNYLSTRFALEESGLRPGLRPIAVQHHHAHIASCMADNGLDGRVIGVALDGTGYGTDGKIWGGEFLTCDFADFVRCGHLGYIPLAGGDSAVRQPWRSALAYLGAAFGSESTSLPLNLFQAVPPKQVAFVNKMISQNIQVVETSSCGRLFDAMASILGVRHETTYEGQAAIELEAVATDDPETYPVDFHGTGPFQIDFRKTIQSVVQDALQGTPVPVISGRFHRTMGQVVVDACDRIRESEGLNRVCLSGGAFQNLRLLKYSADGLRGRGFEVFIHRRVPPNDGGLSLGQAVIANRRVS
ncbi:MAG TPA: carbamoyltransferase HypF [Bryobacteraceae bacterium]|nr:carbamoyltransferase HypF [Bryobacteraceae bacterium]